MQCPRCGRENRDERRFCAECATPLAVSCHACGFSNEPGAKFCGGCAAPLTVAIHPREAKFSSPQSYTPKHLAEKILLSKSALEGERKQVTVLFADLKGSLELLADRDPEEARDLLDPVLERMMEAVHRYEGTVNQVMGDGIMALFGAPVAHEDHAVRACYAALRMQEAVRRHAESIQRTGGIPLQIRVGLNAGEVVVRSIGSDLHMDYTAVGQTTHLAARMEQMAMAGSVLMTAGALRLAEGYVQVNRLGLIPVKGLSEAIEIYELTGAGPLRSRLQAAAARGFTRFVGRTAEIEQLSQAGARARDGHGQVVAVVGEPGVGKSRLYWEFTHSHRAEGWLTLEAGSFSYGKATAFLPIIEMLHTYFQIEPRDDVRKMREKVTGKVLSLDRALEPGLSALLWLLDVPVDDPQWDRLDPPQRRQKTLDAVKRLLIRESQVQPLVVLVEDLHWIDTETQALLDNLIESLPTARLLLLVNYRPEYQHPWGGKSYYRQFRIDPLPPESTEEFLEALLGHDESLAPVKRLLIERTEGNPFFLEESARALIETNVLAGERGAYRLCSTPDDLQKNLQIPATAQAVLAARIDRLSPEDKRLLHAAAVIGHDVPFPLLLAIAEDPEDVLRQRLARLQVAEFFYEARLFPDLEYTFKHALTYEVAYRGLLHDRRRQLHAAVVVAMEHHYAGRLNEIAERLAHHAVRGEAWEKAVTHLWQAGRNARSRSAYRQAVVFLDQALQILKQLPETDANVALGIDLLCRDLSDPLATLTEYEQLIDHLGDAARRAEKVGDRARLTNVLARTVLALRTTGQDDRAVQIGERALALAVDLADARLTALAGMALGSVHSLRGDTRRAEALLRQALGSADSLPVGTGEPDTEWLRRMTLGFLVMVLTASGRYQEAVRYGEEALRMAEDLGHPAPMAGALYRLGFAYGGRGEVGKAVDLGSRSLALARERDVRTALQGALVSLGTAYTLAGRADEAVSHLEQAIAAGESAYFSDAFTLVSLGQAYLTAGRLESALSCARDALARCRQRARRNAEADALHLLGDVAARREPPALEEAVQHYHQALALADERGLPPVVAHCHLGLGTLYGRIGDRAKAAKHLTTAASMYRAMNTSAWLARAEAELAVLA